MINEQLLDFVRQQAQRGISGEEIKKSLLASGWQSADIEEAFRAAQVPAPVQNSAPKGRQKPKKGVILVAVLIVFISAVAIFRGKLAVTPNDTAPEENPGVQNFPTSPALSGDISVIDDSDLKLKNVSAAQSDNAYFDLIKLADAIYEPRDKPQAVVDLASGKMWDNALAEEIISKNSKAFEYFSAAASRAKFQDPAYSDPAGISPYTILPSMISWRKMANISAVKALHLSKQGKDKEALEEALKTVQVGQKIQDSQVPLVEYLIAMNMKSTGLETAQKIVVGSKLASVELAQYSRQLDQYHGNENGYISAFKGEYHIQAWAVDTLLAGDEKALESMMSPEEIKSPEFSQKMKLDYYFQPNKTKLLFAGYAREQIKNANLPCGEAKAVEVKRLVSDKAAGLYKEENAVGKILHDTVAVNLDSVMAKKCEEDLLVGATQVFIAIKAYKNDTGNYPSVLAELAPKYLPSVPADPFDGKPLRYSASKKMIYSVGPDLKDLGGSMGDDWKKMPNPTFNLGF